MERKHNSKALIKNFQPDADMFVGRNGRKTHFDFMQDLSRLISALQNEVDNTYLVNICEDRYFFTLAFSAGLACGFTNLLPQNNQPEILRLLAEKYGHIIVIADYAQEERQADYYVSTLLSLHSPVAMDVPEIPENQLSVIAFTSGSTGEPEPNQKMWHTLTGTVEKLTERLLSNVHIRPVILATVPGQHMYGLEMTAMMALYGKGAVYIDKPFFPGDIVEALSLFPQQAILVTTPVHLRVLLASHLILPHVIKIVSATAPLSIDMALEAEKRMQTVLEEIYGCTEAGSMATRRSTQNEYWQLLKGMNVFKDVDGFWVRGDHLSQPACLQDMLELKDDTCFKLIGRSSDMINVGGKRASLAHLNQLLLSIDGVSDGVVFLPECHTNSHKNNDALRTSAFVVSSLSEQEILSALSKMTDAIFLPRPLVKVKQILRNETGKISHKQLQKMQRDIHA